MSARSSTLHPDRGRPSALGPGYRNVPWALLLALLAWNLVQLAGSRRAEAARPEPEAQAQAADVVLRVGDEILRVADVQAQIDRLPPAVRARQATREDRRTFLDALIKNEIVAREAIRLGYDRDPEIAAATRKAVTLKLLKERLGNEPAPDEISGAAIERYYADHAGELAKPGEARVTQLVVKDRQEALSLLREATKLAASEGSDRGAFRRLVLDRSEEAGVKDDGGDFTVVAGHPGDLPRPLVDAALALREVGELSPLVETAEGFHILKLRQRVPAVTPSLEESRARVIKILTDESRRRKVEALVAALSKSLHVEVFEENLARVRFD